LLVAFTIEDAYFYVKLISYTIKEFRFLTVLTTMVECIFLILIYQCIGQNKMQLANLLIKEHFCPCQFFH